MDNNNLNKEGYSNDYNSLQNTANDTPLYNADKDYRDQITNNTYKSNIGENSYTEQNPYQQNTSYTNYNSTAANNFESNTPVNNNYSNPYINSNSTGYTNNYSNNVKTDSTANASPYIQPDGYYHRSFVNNNNTPKNQKPKKEKGKVSGGVIAVLLAACIIISGCMGFGGTILANKILKGNSSSTTDGSLVIHKVEAENVKSDESENLVDKSTSEITSEVADSVVEITTEVMTTSNFYGQYVATGAGSGVIISEDGYIITNNHVIEGASSITVTLRNSETYPAKLVGKDADLDIALIKIDESGLKVAVFGDSEKLQVGDKAVAIGNPLGQLGGTVTDGIISALNRSVVVDNVTRNLLQTDTAINPGNSGGGLFNGQGELVGIVESKSTGSEIEGLGFAIPINDVLDVISDLKEHGYVTGKAALKMSFVDLTNPMYSMYYYGNTETGCYIYSVDSGSNAEQAGLKQGDRVISINGKEISGKSDIESIVNDLSVGDEVKFVVERQGKKLDISMKAEEYKPSISDMSSDSSFEKNIFG